MLHHIGTGHGSDSSEEDDLEEEFEEYLNSDEPFPRDGQGNKSPKNKKAASKKTKTGKKNKK